MGKEGFATVGWNVHILANWKIIYIAPPQPGGTNDKTFLRHDALIGSMRESPLFTAQKWRVHVANVNEIQGCASLCDGGYHEWAVCMAGMKHPVFQNEGSWACRMESVRKNVERVFGQMKTRFRVPSWHRRGRRGIELRLSLLHAQPVLGETLDFGLRAPNFGLRALDIDLLLQEHRIGVRSQHVHIARRCARQTIHCLLGALVGMFHLLVAAESFAIPRFWIASFVKLPGIHLEERLT